MRQKFFYLSAFITLFLFTVIITVGILGLIKKEEIFPPELPEKTSEETPSEEISSEEELPEIPEGEEPENTCQDECSLASSKKCSNNTYQICGNYDEDECLEWSSTTNCPSNTVCQNGNCIQQKCTDGTSYGQCSTNKPKYCDNSNLADKCTLCGCPTGQSCNISTEACYTPTPTCSDGTPYNQCSTAKPKYCDNGILFDRCLQCGCFESQICDRAINKCVQQSTDFEVFVKTKASGQYASMVSYDDKLTIIATVTIPWVTLYPAKETKIFLDNNQVETCNYVSRCEVTLNPLNVGDHSYYAISTDELGLQKRSENVRLKVIPMTVSHLPTILNDDQKITITVDVISSEISSAIIYFKEFSIGENDIEIKKCDSFPCSITIGPYDIGRHSYYATYQEETGGVTPVRDLWIYTKENFAEEGCKSIYNNGDSNKNLDIVFVGHGYKISEFPRYASAVEEAKTLFLDIEPFKTFSNKINFWRVDKFEDLGCEQDLLCNLSKVEQIASICPYDQILISKYGDFAGVAAGYYGGISLFGDNDPYVAVHEFGHSFGGLLDERGDGAHTPSLDTPETESNCDCIINSQTGQCETEVTNTLNVEGKIYVNPNIPCPKWSEIANTGCFIGCGELGNWFRSTDDGGVMRASRLKYFDPVSLKHITDLLNKFFNIIRQ